MESLWCTLEQLRLRHRESYVLNGSQDFKSPPVLSLTSALLLALEHKA